jgi:hypothetical protein
MTRICIVIALLALLLPTAAQAQDKLTARAAADLYIYDLHCSEVPPAVLEPLHISRPAKEVEETIFTADSNMRRLGKRAWCAAMQKTYRRMLASAGPTVPRYMQRNYCMTEAEAGLWLDAAPGAAFSDCGTGTDLLFNVKANRYERIYDDNAVLCSYKRIEIWRNMNYAHSPSQMGAYVYRITARCKSDAPPELGKVAPWPEIIDVWASKGAVYMQEVGKIGIVYPGGR